MCGENIPHRFCGKSLEVESHRKFCGGHLYFLDIRHLSQGPNVLIRIELIIALFKSPNNLNRAQEKELREIISKNLAVVLSSVS